VWVFRWRELQADGSRVQKKKTIGDVRRFPKKSDVQKEVENLRAEINAKQDRIGKMTVRELWGHFQEHELYRKADGPADIVETFRSPVTIDLYLDNFKRYIIPRWGDCFLEDIKAVRVEKWLGSLPYAPATKAKYRNQLSCLFSHAIRHELWKSYNPIIGPSKGSGVRQSAKRLKTPDILSMAEMESILRGLKVPMHRVAVLIAAVMGLRRSEIRGLKWSDVLFDELWVTLKRGVVRTYLTKLKTEGSRKGLPMPQELADVLLEWRSQTPYRADDDWVFASPTTGGRSPIWLDIVLRNYIQPVAKAAGITKTIGWHTWRRSLASLLAKKKEPVKVVQELLRHSNPEITAALYQQADVEDKRAAQDHVSGLFLVPMAS
jgi:integrase